MQITQNGKAVSRIVLGRRATWLETHAADQLKRYVRQLSGACLLITYEQDACPAMGGLPETPAGTTLEVPCGEHYEGMMTGTCSIYGVWTSVDVSQCGRGGRER